MAKNSLKPSAHPPRSLERMGRWPSSPALTRQAAFSLLRSATSLRNSVAYESLQAEVDGAFPGGEEPLDVTKLGQMEWLNGCMWVASRLCSELRRGFSPRTAMRRFVFNRRSPVDRNTEWIRIKAERCSENCKLNALLI